MWLYRVNFYSNVDSSQGFGWYTSERDALAACRKYKNEDPEEREPELERVDFKLTKKDVLRLLNRFASEPQNG